MSATSASSQLPPQASSPKKGSVLSVGGGAKSTNAPNSSSKESGTVVDGANSKIEVDGANSKIEVDGANSKIEVDEANSKIEVDGANSRNEVDGITESNSKRNISIVEQIISLDSEYVKKHLGTPLTLALADIVKIRPSDPINYLGHWLLKWRWNQDEKLSYEASVKALETEQERIKVEALEKEKRIAAKLEKARALQLAEAELVVKGEMEKLLEGLDLPDLPEPIAVAIEVTPELDIPVLGEGREESRDDDSVRSASRNEGYDDDDNYRTSRSPSEDDDNF